MNRDDIMRLVVEAGGVEGEEVDRHLQPIEGSTFVEFSENQLKAFVVLIEAAEREACAKVCDANVYVQGGIAQQCAAEIRARGET
jgi:hypothetical protein